MCDFNSASLINYKDENVSFNYVVTNTSCWEVQNNSERYAYICIKGKLIGAHRYYYMKHVLKIEKLDEDIFVLHSCGNKKCFNPKHLRIGNRQDNANDMKLFGEISHGENHYKAKLTEKEVDLIKKLYRTGTKNQYELSSIFQVNQSNISRLIHSVNWKHLK